MKTLSYAELIEMLSKPGATILGIDALTDAKAKKTNNPFGEIFKKSRAVVMVGANYESSVNRQHEREHGSEGDFVADSLPWGQWLIPNKVISHKGELYLRTQTTIGQRKQRPVKVVYLNAEGRSLPYETVKPFLPADHGSAKQEAYGVQGEVKVRNYKLSSILRLRVNGETVMLQETIERNAIAAKRAPSFTRIKSKRPARFTPARVKG